jgi:ParB-like chromosome segregation protein Spo0J
MMRVSLEKLSPHPLALSLIPEMAEVEYLALVESIRKSGIRVPLDVIEKDDRYLVIDGVHRLRAARELGLKKVPVNVVVLTEQEIESHIISVQNARRNLTPAQKAVLVLEWMERSGMGADEAVKRFGVSKRAIEVARSVKETNPGVLSLMRKGLISISEAHSAREVHDVRVIREEIRESIGSLAERVEILEQEKSLLEEKIKQQKLKQDNADRLRDEVRRLKKEKAALVSLVKRLHAIAGMEKTHTPVCNPAGAEDILSVAEKAPIIDPLPEILPSESDTISDAISDALSLLRADQVKRLILALESADRISRDSLEKVKLLFDEMRSLISSITAALSRLALKARSEDRADTFVILKKDEEACDLQDEQGA